MSFKILCPVCLKKLNADENDRRIEADKKLLLYKEPNGSSSTCCAECYDKIVSAHYQLIQDIHCENVKKQREEKALKKSQVKEPNETKSCLCLITSKILSLIP